LQTLPAPEIVTARALAPLKTLLEYAEPWLERGAQALFLKGQDIEAELTESAKSWHIEASLIPSVTDPRGRIVQITSARRLSARA
jgi:16S rRNA (guanine527-N7)-methyltransferase